MSRRPVTTAVASAAATIATASAAPAQPSRRCSAGCPAAISSVWATNKAIHALNAMPWTATTGGSGELVNADRR